MSDVRPQSRATNCTSAPRRDQYLLSATSGHFQVEMMHRQEGSRALFPTLDGPNHPSGLGIIAPSRATAAAQPPTHVRGLPGTHRNTLELVFPSSRPSASSRQRTDVIVCNERQLSASCLTKRVWATASLVLHNEIWRKLCIKSPASSMG